jgi:hypothetical protein
MTAEHCIGSMNTEYEFMGEESTCSATNGNCWMCERGDLFDAESLELFDASNDYALVKLAANPELSKYGYLDLDLEEAAIDDEIYIPQHPAGRAKVCLATICSSVWDEMRSPALTIFFFCVFPGNWNVHYYYRRKTILQDR